MPETRRSPNFSHRHTVPYIAICHKEEDEDEMSWSEEEEDVGKNLINVEEKGSVLAVNGRGLEKTWVADCAELQDFEIFNNQSNLLPKRQADSLPKKQTNLLPKNGLRLHHRRTMGVRELVEKAPETVL